jgi:hypothetical protein
MNAGSPHVDGDKEDPEMDDLDKEMRYMEVDKDDRQQVTEAMLQGHMSYGRTHEDAVLPAMQPSYPYLTNSQVQHIHTYICRLLMCWLLACSSCNPHCIPLIPNRSSLSNLILPHWHMLRKILSNFH